MASTAHKTKEAKKEYFDTPEELEKKIDQLAQWIKESRHFIAFTGAGISTSAGVPDFRSGVDTVLETGPGAWEKLATRTKRKPKKVVEMYQAVPTYSHMSLNALEETGHLKFLISQNVDGLHLKSGFPKEKLAELHGNDNLEICRNKNCLKQYLRDFSVEAEYDEDDHETGRKCESCGENLYDTIIDFGESLPETDLRNGFYHAESADLCLVLGSSLRVTPAANMPLETYKNNGKLVIVNLQETPLDEMALKIHAMIDTVMIMLMQKLGITVSPFNLVRRLSVKRVYDAQVSKKSLETKEGLVLRGVDGNGDPYELFPQIHCCFLSSKERRSTKKEPYLLVPKNSELSEGILQTRLTFQGYYGEPPLVLDIDLSKIPPAHTAVITMTYDVTRTQQWKVQYPW